MRFGALEEGSDSEFAGSGGGDCCAVVVAISVVGNVNGSVVDGSYVGVGAVYHVSIP